jgi:FkbM family methyltransferase
MTIIYKIIYSPYINFILRNTNKLLKNLFKNIKIPPSGIIKIRLNNNKVIKYKTNQSGFVGYCIFWNGIYQYEYTYIFERIIDRIRVFVDIGSNAGIYSLMAAKLSENIKVLAFDPTEASSYYLTENIRLNHLHDKILPFKYAISDKNEILNFYEVKNPKYPYLKYNLGGASSLVNMPDKFNMISVKAYTFDTFLKEHHLDEISVDLIKIDAEGAEPEIIRGMKNTIEKFNPIIVSEILMNDTGKEIEELLRESGYKFFLHKGLHLYQVDRIEENTSDESIYNYFLVHPSKLHIIEEFVR